MLICIQNLFKFCPLVLKILSGNENYDGMTGQTGQIQYSPHFFKRGYNDSSSMIFTTDTQLLISSTGMNSAGMNSFLGLSYNFIMYESVHFILF